MTDHRAAAADAAALIRDLAGATGDPFKAYASPDDVAAVTESLRDLARHLEDALEHLALHVARRRDWAAADAGEAGQYPRVASNKIRFAGAQAKNMSRALEGAVEALGHLRPAP
ncbi:hypothetical protein ACFW6F_17655 [Streptomyces sp. NPDC058746]|uniref:hypothetical protein n=1 Tax=Streptomyces sp. NPDC058746 TaxID=3346622 RepID=UPI0036933A94